MTPGLLFVKTWRIRNVGTVPWRGTKLERQGPLTGPGLITSIRHVEIPDTDPGEIARSACRCKRPPTTAQASPTSRWSIEDGFLCFPDEHASGLDVLVRVERNTAGSQD